MQAFPASFAHRGQDQITDQMLSAADPTGVASDVINPI
jgi:hypothetical protein